MYGLFCLFGLLLLLHDLPPDVIRRVACGQNLHHIYTLRRIAAKTILDLADVTSFTGLSDAILCAILGVSSTAVTSFAIHNSIDSCLLVFAALLNGNLEDRIVSAIQDLSDDRDIVFYRQCQGISNSVEHALIPKGRPGVKLAKAASQETCCHGHVRMRRDWGGQQGLQNSALGDLLHYWMSLTVTLQTLGRCSFDVQLQGQHSQC